MPVVLLLIFLERLLCKLRLSLGGFHDESQLRQLLLLLLQFLNVFEMLGGQSSNVLLHHGLLHHTETVGTSSLRDTQAKWIDTRHRRKNSYGKIVVDSRCHIRRRLVLPSVKSGRLQTRSPHPHIPFASLGAVPIATDAIQSGVELPSPSLSSPNAAFAPTSSPSLVPIPHVTWRGTLPSKHRIRPSHRHGVTHGKNQHKHGQRTS
mmetsp:Transcript_8265/g.22917  ORF Transcript_8265/g.22917 Transcript_8265/m.22917 type:complete len:206 (+) Transcript_8265:1223-1840(+)